MPFVTLGLTSIADYAYSFMQIRWETLILSRGMQPVQERRESPWLQHNQTPVGINIPNKTKIIQHPDINVYET